MIKRIFSEEQHSIRKEVRKISKIVQYLMNEIYLDLDEVQTDEFFNRGITTVPIKNNYIANLIDALDEEQLKRVNAALDVLVNRKIILCVQPDSRDNTFYLSICAYLDDKVQIEPSAPQSTDKFIELQADSAYAH